MAYTQSMFEVWAVIIVRGRRWLGPPSARLHFIIRLGYSLHYRHICEVANLSAYKLVSAMSINVNLELDRQDKPNTPWGFRLTGGKDFGTKLTVQRVNTGGLAAQQGLKEGDIILKIGEHDANKMRHKDAQQIIIDAGEVLKLVVTREGIVDPNARDQPMTDATKFEGYSSTVIKSQEPQQATAATTSDNNSKPAEMSSRIPSTADDEGSGLLEGPPVPQTPGDVRLDIE